MKTPPPTKNRASPEPTILTPSSQMSGLQICRKSISVAEAPSLLFCYGSPSRLRQCVLLHLLLLLSIMCLRCIHIVAVSELHSFSWLCHSPLCAWTPFCLSTHPSILHPTTHHHPSTHAWDTIHGAASSRTRPSD